MYRLITLSLLAACGATSSDPPAPPAPPEAAPPPGPVVATRGLLAAEAGALRFTPCGGAPAPLTDATGGVLEKARAALGAEANGDLFLVGAIQGGALTTLSRLNASGGADGCAAPEPRFKAAGNEPFWRIVGDDATGRVSFATPDGPGFDLPSTPFKGDATTQELSIQADGHDLKLTLTSGGCSDTMAPFWFAWTAKATVDGVSYTGCASYVP